MSYYICPKCGSQTKIEKSIFAKCPVCEEPVSAEDQENIKKHIELMSDVDKLLSETETSADLQDSTEYVYCPKCLSSRIIVKEKGYNVTKATIGSIIGARDAWLWGMWDMKDKVCTCKDCGSTFDAQNAVHGKHKNITDAKQYVEEHLSKDSDAKIARAVESKFGVRGLDESYMRSMREKLGIKMHHGINFLSVFVALLMGAVVAGIVNWLWDVNFYIILAISAPLIYLSLLFKK